jgi:hypothetical protein
VVRRARVIVVSLLAAVVAAVARAEEPSGGVSEPVAVQVIRAPEWVGAVNVTDGGCNASMGEYTLWVYATATDCGVPREQADRVAIIRQPLPGISPIRVTTRLPTGTYAVWAYGAGTAAPSQVRVCAKGCIIGDLPAAPAWALIGWIELRENQVLFLRSWQQPEGKLYYVQQMVLTSSGEKPDWTP